MGIDLLSGVTWECRATTPGVVKDPDAAASLDPQGWRFAPVPGTAAAATRMAGEDPDWTDYDASDWWFRCSFAAAGDPASGHSGTNLLRLGGMATIADVWLNGQHLLRSENMFRSYEIEVADLRESNELYIGLTSLKSFLAERRKRPRWRTYLVSHQNLRFVRTTLLGRMPGWAVTPAPVGPYRYVELIAGSGPRLTRRRVFTSCAGTGGIVRVDLRVRGAGGASGAILSVAGHAADISVHPDGDELMVTGEVRVPEVARWWPHTHGTQPLYPVDLEIAGQRIHIGRVGFKTVELDRSDGGFTLSVNGRPIFCRGAVWMPPDPIGHAPDRDEVRATLEMAKAANLNLIRLPGTGVYQDEYFWNTCDELGLLVWQEGMLAFCDPPEDPEFVKELEGELTEQFEMISGHPALAIVCGNQEVEEQAAMQSLPRDKWHFLIYDETVPKLVDALLPGIPYVTSNPTGGTVPYQMDTGISHYFGVGGYLRPVEDARRAKVKFASECLAFAPPPERRTVDDECGGAERAGHDPGWKLAVHHDAGRSWDLEDMQSYYLRKIFAVDPFELRYRDAERALDLSRATVATLFETVLSEWRRPGSSCSGAIVLALRDLRPGPGWGVIDSFGRPKAPWFVLRRVHAPVALLLTDEGLNGLSIHLVNDNPGEVTGRLVVELFVRGELMVESVERPVSLDAYSGEVVEVSGMFDGFRDLTGAYGFGPPAYDVVSARLVGEDGEDLAGAIHLPGGVIRTHEFDVGLEADLTEKDGMWSIDISTTRFAQWVVVEVPGFRPDDSWFHLPPGGHKKVVLHPQKEPVRPESLLPLAGEVRALNSARSVRFAAPS
ncbi:MAG: hypothetical protein WAM97_13660 [Acidimicrobiales bacterium]